MPTRWCASDAWRSSIRYEFGSDVVVDLIGFRRHGHSEVDDPTITQPILYRKIKDHPLALPDLREESWVRTRSRTWRSSRPSSTPPRRPARAWSRSRTCGNCPATGRRITVVPTIPQDEVDTGLPAATLHEITDGLVQYPEDFHIHPKVQKLLEQRREMGYGKRPLDFGMAEALAFGSLAMQGVPIRLSGQDSRRGTFNQRHSVLIDIVDEKEYVPVVPPGARSGAR